MAPDRVDEDEQIVEGENVTDRSERRQAERTEQIERMIGDEAAGMLETQKYPVTSEELSAEYANTEIELANETESLGNVFGRLVDARFESPAEAREALFNELSGQAGGSAEFNDQRDVETLAEDDSPERNRE